MTKRLVLLATALSAVGFLAPAAHAAPVSPEVASTDSYLSTASSSDSRHICVISDQLDKSWCVYVDIP